MTLVWTRPAILDLQDIERYIGRDSVFYARRFIANMLEATDGLEDHPRLGRTVPETEDEAIRELIFRSYRIIYRLEEDRILILAVIHGSRDLAQMEKPPWEVE